MSLTPAFPETSQPSTTYEGRLGTSCVESAAINGLSGGHHAPPPNPSTRQRRPHSPRRSHPSPGRPQTVDRWFAGRVPYPRHRNELARLTSWKIDDLWPDTADRGSQPATDEVIATYANRSLVPADTWRRLFRNAIREIDIVAYSALFLLEDPAIVRILADRAAAGVMIRIALGDPDGQHVARRGADEHIGEVMTAKVRNALV